MPSKVSEGETKKSRTRLSKSEERILANQILNPVKPVDRQEMIATAASRAMRQMPCVIGLKLRGKSIMSWIYLIAAA